MMIEAAQDGFPFLGAVNRRIRDFPHQCRQSAAVVIFVVVHDDIVDVFEVDFFFQVGDKFIVKRFPDRIHEDRLFIANQIRVIRRTLFCGIFMAVKFVQFPVDFTYPSYFVCNFFTHDDSLLFLIFYLNYSNVSSKAILKGPSAVMAWRPFLAKAKFSPALIS